jgi:hypothetical protein
MEGIGKGASSAKSDLVLRDDGQQKRCEDGLS